VDVAAGEASSADEAVEEGQTRCGLGRVEGNRRPIDGSSDCRSIITRPSIRVPSMTRKFLAFDIETARIGDGLTDWRTQRPLGITCAAALASDADAVEFWHGKNPDGTTAPKMDREEVRSLLEHLLKAVSNGYTLLTWNGLGFDFDILAEESGNHDACRQLALDHVDMMYHVFCHKGFAVALDKAAQGLRLPGKSSGMSGSDAPRMWAEGCYGEVLDYVRQDVRTAIAIALKCEGDGRFAWLTAKGKVSSLPLSTGWLRVRDAIRLPLPDTSWMENPMPREHFSAWFSRKQS
jgi:hypothetical protein